MPIVLWQTKNELDDQKWLEADQGNRKSPTTSDNLSVRLSRDYYTLVDQKMRALIDLNRKARNVPRPLTTRSSF